MVRGIAVLTSALAAVGAQAQDAQPSRDNGKIVLVTPDSSKGGDQLKIVLASTTPMADQNARTSPDSPAKGSSTAPNARAIPDQGTSTAPADCSEEALLSDAPLAIRVYKASPPAHWGNFWKEPPAVSKATHCGSKYIIQVRSRSADPWVLKAARLEGAGGELLKVERVRSRLGEDGWTRNIITVEVPQGVGADFPLLKLHLVGEDGRVALLDGVVLP
jgi:hypothetical protein